MTQRICFAEAGVAGSGTLDGERIEVYGGDMCASPQSTGRSLARGSVVVLTPTAAGKMVGLSNNFRSIAAKLRNALPIESLYFIKRNHSHLATGQTIHIPKSNGVSFVYERELGVVIGKTCRAVSEAEVQRKIFRCTYINGVTAIGILNLDVSVAQ
ncbi:MAG: fumarylacetoacetate hydrolase family protein [Betaproteobacteria bacterium]|nr:fumarylacetoacetate hydrolase family protein [Betaproteobacteria bacterium]